jgi:hypothetical protein
VKGHNTLLKALDNYINENLNDESHPTQAYVQLAIGFAQLLGEGRDDDSSELPDD